MWSQRSKVSICVLLPILNPTSSYNIVQNIRALEWFSRYRGPASRPVWHTRVQDYSVMFVADEKVPIVYVCLKAVLFNENQVVCCAQYHASLNHRALHSVQSRLDHQGSRDDQENSTANISVSSYFIDISSVLGVVGRTEFTNWSRDHTSITFYP